MLNTGFGNGTISQENRNIHTSSGSNRPMTTVS